MLPKHVANAHQKGDIHYHDLDYSPYTPMITAVWSILKACSEMALRLGMQVEDPKSIQATTAQISQIIANVASSQYRGCSADRS